MWGNLSGNDICKADWMFAGINKHDKWLVLSSSPPLAFPYTYFFRLILTPFLKGQEPKDPRRLFCLFAHGTKATPLL
jgi:hypothetical protein